MLLHSQKLLESTFQEVKTQQVERIAKTLDPNLLECEMCREFKTKENFEIALRNSDFKDHRPLIVCDWCKSNFFEALKKRDQNSKFIKRGAEIGMY